MDTHLIGGARRAPMNQDEFDTKFNFLSERRTNRHRQYSIDSIVEEQPEGADFLCGASICWRRAAQRSISIVTRAPPPPPPPPLSQQVPQHKKSRQHLSLASGNSGSGGANMPLPRYQLSNTEEDARLRTSQDCLNLHLPLIRVLQRYSFRKDAFGDLRAGVALALHSAAEGLAMAMLAGLPPIAGLHTTFCATLLYMVFGTSNFSFLGTNMIVCFFLRSIIDRSITTDAMEQLSTAAQQAQIAATLTFLCAVIQGLVYVLHLDFVFTFCSEPILSGLALGSALRILFAQLGNIFQLKSDRIICASEFVMKEASMAGQSAASTSTGSFPCIIWAYYRRLNGPKRAGGYSTLQNLSVHTHIANLTLDRASQAAIAGNSCLPSLWECLDAINLNVLAASVACILLLVFARQLIGPLTRFRLRSAVSSEFLMILLAGQLSRWLNAEKRWQLETVKFAGGNMFHFTFPQVALFGHLFWDSLALAALVHTMHVRSANALARTHKYKVDEKQELFCLTLINMFASFFSAFSPGQSPLRSHLGIRAGAKTILTNVSLVLTLVPLILWAPELFQALPVCVLSCILLVAVCPLFTGIARLPLLWSVSRLDVLTFAFSALAALCFADLSQALFCAIACGAGTIVVRAQWPRLQQLVNVTGSGVYYAERCFYGSDLMDESGVSVIRYEAPILFHNAKHFKAAVLEAARKIKGQLLGVGIGTRTGSMKSQKSMNATAILCSQSGVAHNKESLQMKSTLLMSGDLVPNYENLLGTSLESGAISKVLIVDCSSVPYLDAQGISVMRELFEELAEKKCRLLFASVNATIRSWFKVSGAFDHVPKHYFFPSVHDAVLCAQQMGGIIAPSIHMSVSMNGCRDLIALSNAASNHELNVHSETASAQTMGAVTIAATTELASLCPSGGRPGRSTSPTHLRHISLPQDVTFGQHARGWPLKLPLKKSNS